MPLASGRRGGLLWGLQVGVLVTGDWPLDAGVSAPAPPTRAIKMADTSKASERRSGNPPARALSVLTRLELASCDRGHPTTFSYSERRSFRERGVRAARAQPGWATGPRAAGRAGPLREGPIGPGSGCRVRGRRGRGG